MSNDATRHLRRENSMQGAQRYRKKPVVIEAIRYDDTDGSFREVTSWIHRGGRGSPPCCGRPEHLHRNPRGRDGGIAWGLRDPWRAGRALHMQAGHLRGDLRGGEQR